MLQQLYYILVAEVPSFKSRMCYDGLVVVLRVLDE